MGGMRTANQAALKFMQAAFSRTGIHPTDLKVIEFLRETKAAAAHVLGDVAGLTSGATTAMIDRLERMGLVSRSDDATDRRKVIVRLDANFPELPPFLNGFFIELEKELGACDTEELATIAKFNAAVERIFNEQRDIIIRK